MIMTHKGEILEYLQADKAMVIINGRVFYFNEPRKIFKCIQIDGYDNCLYCDLYEESFN
jgi:Fe-S cluster assembly ATP-binding protein